MKHCPKISLSIRNVKTLLHSTDFNRDNFELLQIDWSMPYDVKLPTPTTVVDVSFSIRQFFVRRKTRLSDGSIG